MATLPIAAVAVLLAPSLGGLVPPPPLPPPAPAPAHAIRECFGVPLPTAGPDSAFTAMWSLPRAGWTGGDGTLSAPLPDGSVVWAFGDTFLDGIDASGHRTAATTLVRNTLVRQSGACLSTLTGGTDAQPKALFDTGDRDRWYWPGQPFVEAGALRVPLSRIVRTGPGRFDFAFAGSALATLRLPDLAVASIRSLTTPGDVAWGAAIVPDGAFTYVFGVAPADKSLHLSRAPREEVAGGEWRYWSAAGWSSDPAASMALLGGVSEQLSVVRGPTGWALVSQRPGFSPEIGAWHAAAPQGPWTGGETIAVVPMPAGAISYNANLHPEFGTGDGGVLVSSNLMPVDDDDLLMRPDLARATWIRVPLATG
jgi:hypothetical protein